MAAWLFVSVVSRHVAIFVVEPRNRNNVAMPMEPKKFRIALALQSDAISSTRHFFLGAHQFAHTQPDWQIVREDNTTMLNWEQAIQSQPDGILGVLFGEQQRSIEPGKGCGPN